jgi:hypothetical protein
MDSYRSAKALVFILIFGIISILSIFFPRTLMGKGKSGIFGLTGAVIDIFPECIQTWVARFSGLLLTCFSLWFFNVVFPGFLPELNFKTLDEVEVAERINFIQDEYSAVFDSGSNRIAVFVKGDSSKAAVFSIDQFDSENTREAASLALRSAQWAILNDKGKPITLSEWEGEELIIQDIEKTPPAALPVSVASSEEAINQGHDLVSESRKLWNEGRMEESIAKAREAQLIFTNHLGDDHADTKKVAKMVLQAERIYKQKQMDAN